MRGLTPGWRFVLKSARTPRQRLMWLRVAKSPDPRPWDRKHRARSRLWRMRHKRSRFHPRYKQEHVRLSHLPRKEGRWFDD